MPAKKANTTTTPKTEKKAVNIEDLFSRTNEENGVWFRPNTSKYCPIQFLVVGPSSSTAWVVNDEYSKGLKQAQEITDLKEKAAKIVEVTSKRYAGLCIDLKVDDDVILYIGGELCTKEKMYDIMYGSPEIQDEIYRFYNESENFLGIKKNA